ncbi:MAG: hypothetical protein GY943_02455, partial [Chloroflexi bacterium]|nr:hypothetical protein [Chloroflexota bacterium]
KERITTYHFNNKGLCHVRTTKKGVDVGLLKGAQLNDPYNQLHGKTKKMRVYSMQQLNQEILAYYLQSSIDLIRRLGD